MNQILIKETNFQKARELIRENKGKKIIFASRDDELNRKILEKEKISVLLISLERRKDRMKQRDSGFNQVLAKLAKKNNVSIGINLDELQAAKSAREKSDLLARARQNIKLASKNKLKMEFFSGKGKTDTYNLKSLGLVLGMPTWMTRAL